MKRAACILVVVLAAACGASAKTNFELAKEYSDYLKFSAYVPAHEIAEYMGTEKDLARAAEILKEAGITKVFLDVHRSGFIPDKDVLVRAREYLRGQGFEVSGGITTTKGGIFGEDSPTHRYFMCYDNDKTRANMKYVSEYAASIFDEVIIDDFLATECKCDECAERKGARGWPEYFRDVMVSISRDQIVGAMKAVNPNVTVIIKYPQWYDRFHMFGYDPGRQPAIFDKVWAGTETRDPDVENVQQYQGYVNYNWIKSLAGDKMTGAWYDQGNTHPEVYLEQAFQSVLAGAREITHFGYTPERFTSDNMKRHTENLEYLFRVAKELHGLKRTGVPAYKPLNSDGGGENYVFDYLGMFGLPIVMTAYYPEDSPVVVLTEHAAADPDIAAKIKTTVAAGGTVLMSGGLAAKLKKDVEIMKLAGLKPPGVKTLKSKMVNRFYHRNDEFFAEESDYVEIGERLFPGNDDDVLVFADSGEEEFPAVIAHETGAGGKIVVFNARTFGYFPNTNDLVIPSPVSYINSQTAFAEALRNSALKPLGMKIYATTKIGVYIFSGQYIAFENFNDSNMKVRMKFENTRSQCSPVGLESIYDGSMVKRIGDSTEQKLLDPRYDQFFDLEIPKRYMLLYKLICD